MQYHKIVHVRCNYIHIPKGAGRTIWFNQTKSMLGKLQFKTKGKG